MPVSWQIGRWPSAHIRELIKALDANDAAGAEAAFAVAQPILDRFSARGLIHKNKAARHKSRLSAAIKGMGAVAA